MTKTFFIMVNVPSKIANIYKTINHITPPIMFEIRENTHNTRYFQVLSNENRRTVNYVLENVIEHLFFEQIYRQDINLQIL